MKHANEMSLATFSVFLGQLVCLVRFPFNTNISIVVLKHDFVSPINKQSG